MLGDVSVVIAAEMAYPGEGYKMSCYGLNRYTSVQVEEQWRESVESEYRIAKSHPATKAREPVNESDRKPINLFNNVKPHKEKSSYDRTFHFPDNFCGKLKRDDMQYTQGLDINSEERGKAVPTLSSSVYGHRSPIEKLERKYAREELVKKDFYRPSGIS